MRGVRPVLPMPDYRDFASGDLTGRDELNVRA